LKAIKHPLSSSKLYRRVCCGLLFFAAASASFQGFYSKWHFRETGVAHGAGQIDELRYGLAEILDGTAARPYVYRQMLPALANWLDKVTPQNIKDQLYLAASHETTEPSFKFESPMAGDRRYFFRYLVVYSGTFLFAWIAVYAMYLVCKAANVPPVARIVAPILMILAIPYFMSGGGYFYDYPELAFLGLAVWIGLKFDWWWLIPVVALATWNKESFLLMVVTLYPILRSRTSFRNAWIGTAVLYLTGGAVFLAVRAQYLQNPGSPVLVKWRHQIKFLLHFSNYFDWETTYGVAMFKAFSLFSLVLIGWTAWKGWSRLPKPIQQHGKIALAINLPMFLLFCSPGEMRDFSMLYIVFLLMVAANLAEETDPGANLDGLTLEHVTPVLASAQSG
jgi:hypothetical protein